MEAAYLQIAGVSVRRRGRAALLAALLLAVTVGTATLLEAPPSASAASGAAALPPIRHVFVINLENTSYSESFGNPSADPYLASILTRQGVLIQNYYGIGHNSLDNYLAEISGQAPNPQTQDDCPDGYTDFSSSGQTDANGQAVGQGCVYPPSVLTLPDQLEANQFTWKGYMQDMGAVPTKDRGYRCAHPALNSNDTSGSSPTDHYVTKHNPFVYFHSIVDDAARCSDRDVPLGRLFTDLQSVATTPNFSFITPNMCDDGHDKCESGGYTFDGAFDGLLPDADRFSAWLLPQILASPAYRQDGMVVLTFDESDVFIGTGLGDDTSCCNEVPGPNSPSPGIGGPGGGKIGAVIISPFVKPGTTTATAAQVLPSTSAPDAYNHYSLLRSLEDLFGITTGGVDGQGHLGFAAKAGAYPGPGAFGNDVYSWSPGEAGVPGQPVGPAPADPTPGAQPVGPRPAGASVAWEAPTPQANDLNAIACPAPGTCLAVGDAGTLLVRDAGGAWTPLRSGVARDLLGVACPSVERCVAVGDGGLALVVLLAEKTVTLGQGASPSTLRAVSCPSSATCFAAGDHGTIERSGDEGLHWSEMASGASERLGSIDCLSGQPGPICFASGGERRTVDLKMTTDGSGTSTWTVLNGSSGGDNGTGVACVTDQRCAISTPSSTVRWTANGGTSWSSLTWKGQTPGNAANRFLGIACATPTVCYVAAERGAVFKLDESVPAITPATASTNVGDDLNDIACPTATTCYAVGEEGQILAMSSTSSGWIPERTGLAPRRPRKAQASDPPDPSISTLRAASCTESGLCVAVGDEGSIASKADPSAGWVSRSSAVPAPTAPLTRGLLNLFGVSCRSDFAASSENCVAVGSFGTVLRSTNGGQDWASERAATPDGEELHGVSCYTDLDCVAVGAYGAILRSADGGASWSRDKSPTPYSLSGVSCSPDGSCVAVGSLGTILRLEPASGSWTPADAHTLAYLAGVSCPGSGECVAVGQNGTAVVSTDGGATWTGSQTGIDDGLNAVDCDAGTPTSCTVTGSNGTVLHTADGGASWSLVGTGTPRDLDGVACVADVVCHSVGEGSAVLAVADQLPTAAPDIGIADVSVDEGNAGIGYAPLTVQLSSPVPTGSEVDVSYATEALSGPGAATPGEDYEPVSGRLRFLPGDSVKTILVPIVGDLIYEGDEDFTVVLSGPDGAFVHNGRAIVTILNDDLAPATAEQQPSDGGTLDGGPAGLSGSVPGGMSGAGGAVFAATRSSPRCHVPRLVKRRLVVAVRLLAHTHCAIGLVVERRSRMRASTVIRQSPRPGATRPGGSRVSLVVSKHARRQARAHN